MGLAHLLDVRVGVIQGEEAAMPVPLAILTAASWGRKLQVCAHRARGARCQLCHALRPPKDGNEVVKGRALEALDGLHSLNQGKAQLSSDSQVRSRLSSSAG